MRVPARAVRLFALCCCGWGAALLLGLQATGISPGGDAVTAVKEEHMFKLPPGRASLPGSVWVRGVYQAPALRVRLTEHRSNQLLYSLTLSPNDMAELSSPIGDPIHCNRSARNAPPPGWRLQDGDLFDLRLEFHPVGAGGEGRLLAGWRWFSCTVSLNGWSLPTFMPHQFEAGLATATQLWVEARSAEVNWRGWQTASDHHQSTRAGAPAPPHRETVRTGALVFLGILTGPALFARRAAVRRGWLMSPLICKSGGSCSGGVQARFFVAPTDNATLDGMVARESAEHGDIVTVRHAIDGYSAIAAKSLAIVEEGERAGAAWVFKTDDDAFVQVDKLVAWLMTLPDGPVYAGNIECFSPPQRESWELYTLTEHEYGFDVLPPFAHGAGYALSHQLAAHIVDQKKLGDLPMAGLEDVSVSLWVERARNLFEVPVKIVHTDQVVYLPNRCDPTKFVIHYMGPSAQRCGWAAHQSGGDLCQCYGANNFEFKDK